MTDRASHPPVYYQVPSPVPGRYQHEAMVKCRACRSQPVHSRGLCRSCYARHWRAGTLEIAASKAYSRPACSLDDCDRPHQAKGYCRSHYDQLVRIAHNPPCEIDGCERPIRARGRCSNHYPQLLSESNPTYAARRRRQWVKDSARRKARLASAEIEDIDPLAVYERDRYRCGLCGGPIDMSTQKPHPRSPTIDHILPLVHGGSHTYANVQAAHFMCNSTKGHRIMGEGEQLRLVG